MAQLDHTIYFQNEMPDFLGNVQKGLSMKEAFDTRKKNKALQDAFKAGVVQSPDGTTTIDDKKTLSALFGADPMAAMKFQKEKQEMDLASQEVKMKKQLQEADLISRLAGNVKDQASYDAALGQASQFGIDVSKLPPVYDQGFVQNLQGMALTAKDRLAQQNWDKDYALKEREVKAKELEAKNKKAENVGRLSEGQKTLDKEFAKDYNDWTSGGSKIALSEIKKLSDVAKSLKNGNLSTGGLTGMFPDRITSDKVLKARADVQSTVMNSLKAILGAQFTEKEGDRIIKNTWNEADTTANNMARVERLVQDLSNQAIEKNRKAKFFEQQSGSLYGYQSKSAPSGTKVVDGVTYIKVPGGWEEAD